MASAIQGAKGLGPVPQDESCDSPEAQVGLRAGRLAPQPVRQHIPDAS